MPEGPEIKRISEDLNNNYRGKILKNIYFTGGRYVKSDLTDSLPQNYLNLVSILPLKIRKIECKGKLIIIVLTSINNNEKGGKFYIFVTMGMTGTFDLHFRQHTHIVFEFEKESKLLGKYLYYADTRRFGTIQFSPDKKVYKKKLASLGGDFLGENVISLQEFSDKIKKNKEYFVKAIMDQKSICSGVGNYALSEILHLSKITNFNICCNELKNDEIGRLYESCKYILNESYKYGGASFKDYHRLDGSNGNFREKLKVYEKGKKVKGKHGRSIYYF